MREVKYTQDGQEKTVVVRKPSSADLTNAQVYSNKVFAKLIRDKDEDGKPTVVLRTHLNSYAKELGIWDDNKETKLKELDTKIDNLEKVLEKGGIKLSEGRKNAIELRKLRNEKLELIAGRNELDKHTLEAQVENAKFDYLVHVCLVNEEGDKLFSSVDDYRENGSEEHVTKAAFELANMMYNLDTNFTKNLPENKFLTKYKFCDEELRLINKDGHLVDIEGRLINEDGRFVDAEGNFVDRDGNRVDEDGNPINSEQQPFLDDEGNPVNA